MCLTLAISRFSAFSSKNMIQFLDKAKLNDTELCQVQASTKTLEG